MFSAVQLRGYDFKLPFQALICKYQIQVFGFKAFHRNAYRHCADLYWGMRAVNADQVKLSAKTIREVFPAPTDRRNIDESLKIG